MVVLDRVVVIADQGYVRLWQFNLLGQITDGQAAWDQFISGVQQTFEKNASGVPILVAVVVVVLVLWLNLRLARWIVGAGAKKSGSRDGADKG